jgi:hypothetical protein
MGMIMLLGMVRELVRVVMGVLEGVVRVTGVVGVMVTGVVTEVAGRPRWIASERLRLTP